jgi:dGTPase
MARARRTIKPARDPADIRYYAEPKKRRTVPDSDQRTPAERDYDRVLHSGSFRRLQAKSQVVHTGNADYFRTRLTHTLEVSQIARSLGERLGLNAPYLVEAAALIHDLGHPPFGHNGEDALKEWMHGRGSFEANAQSFRIVTRLELKFAPSSVRGGRIGLNLSKDSLRASFKYPWPREEGDPLRSRKFGYYEHEPEAEIAKWVLGGETAEKHVVAKVVDIADDIAYSVHDLEDGVRSGLIPLYVLVNSGDERSELVAHENKRRTALGSAPLADLRVVLDKLLDQSRLFKFCTRPYRKDDNFRGAMKGMTSGLIDRFVSAIPVSPGPPTRESDVQVPEPYQTEIAALKAMTWYYVIESQELQTLQYRERKLLTQLANALLEPDGWRLLAEDRRAEMQKTDEEAERARIVCDFLAGMTDRFAQSFHARLFGAEAQAIGNTL